MRIVDIGKRPCQGAGMFFPVTYLDKPEIWMLSIHVRHDYPYMVNSRCGIPLKSHLMRRWGKEKEENSKRIVSTNVGLFIPPFPQSSALWFSLSCSYCYDEDLNSIKKNSNGSCNSIELE